MKERTMPEQPSMYQQHRRSRAGEVRPMPSSLHEHALRKPTPPHNPETPASLIAHTTPDTHVYTPEKSSFSFAAYLAQANELTQTAHHAYKQNNGRTERAGVKTSTLSHAGKEALANYGATLQRADVATLVALTDQIQARKTQTNSPQEKAMLRSLEQMIMTRLRYKVQDAATAEVAPEDREHARGMFHAELMQAKTPQETSHALYYKKAREIMGDEQTHHQPPYEKRRKVMPAPQTVEPVVAEPQSAKPVVESEQKPEEPEQRFAIVHVPRLPETPQAEAPIAEPVQQKNEPLAFPIVHVKQTPEAIPDGPEQAAETAAPVAPVEADASTPQKHEPEAATGETIPLGEPEAPTTDESPAAGPTLPPEALEPADQPAPQKKTRWQRFLSLFGDDESDYKGKGRPDNPARRRLIRTLAAAAAGTVLRQDAPPPRNNKAYLPVVTKPGAKANLPMVTNGNTGLEQNNQTGVAETPINSATNAPETATTAPSKIPEPSKTPTATATETATPAPTEVPKPEIIKDYEGNWFGTIKLGRDWTEEELKQNPNLATQGVIEPQVRVAIDGQTPNGAAIPDMAIFPHRVASNEDYGVAESLLEGSNTVDYIDGIPTAFGHSAFKVVTENGKKTYAPLAFESIRAAYLGKYNMEIEKDFPVVESPEEAQQNLDTLVGQTVALNQEGRIQKARVAFAGRVNPREISRYNAVMREDREKYDALLQKYGSHEKIPAGEYNPHSLIELLRETFANAGHPFPPPNADGYYTEGKYFLLQACDKPIGEEKNNPLEPRAGITEKGALTASQARFYILFEAGE